MTAAVVARGLLEDEHGVAGRDVTWVVGDVDERERTHIPLPDLPAGFTVERAPEGRFLVDMLLAGELDALDEERSRQMERLASGQIKTQPKTAPVPVLIDQPVSKRVRGLARFFDILPLSMQKKRSEPVTNKPVQVASARRAVPLSPVQGPFIRQNEEDVTLVRDPVLFRDDKKGNVLSAIVGVFAPPVEDTDDNQDQGPGPMPLVPPGPVVPVVYPFSGLIPKGGSPDPHPGSNGKTPSGGANPPQPPAVP
jgi:hypothetical protein